MVPESATLTAGSGVDPSLGMYFTGLDSTPGLFTGPCTEVTGMDGAFMGRIEVQYLP